MNTRRARICRLRAFTLLEVLFGLFLLGLAAVVLGAAYVNTLEAHAAVTRRANTGFAADSLREALLNEPDRERVEKGGDVPLPGNRQLRWEALVEETAVPDLFRVTLRGRVLGNAGSAGDEEFEQVLMLLRPTWSDPAKREQLRTEWRAGREEAAKR